jgi:DNA-binding response OmpR family regulator
VADQNQKKILIIDDERDYADILRERLQFEGYDVAVAYDGLSGIKMAKDYEPDLVLLDIMMPELDGFETARQFRTTYPFDALKIIFVTAYGRDPNEAQKEIIGESPFIRKPFNLPELLKVVGKLLA